VTTSKRHQSTPYSRNTHRTFREEPGNMLSRGRQNMSILIWHAPRISRKFAGVEICSVALLQQRKPHWVSPALVRLFSWHHGMHSSWETKQTDGAVVGSFTPVSLFVYGHDQFANLSVPFQNAMPLDTQPSGVLSSPSSLSNFAQLVLSSDLAAASESLLMYSSTEAFICAKLIHPV